MSDDVYAAEGTSSVAASLCEAFESAISCSALRTAKRLQKTLFPERAFDLPQRQAIHHVVFREPAFTGDADAEPKFVQSFDAVRVGVDHALHSFLLCQRPPAPVEIEAFWRSVDLDPGASFRGSF